MGMGTGFGDTQKRTLAELAAHPTGVSVVELAATLGLSPRRCRAVVVSLVDREIVVVTDETRPHKVWLRDLRAAFLVDRYRREFDRDATRALFEAHLPPGVCPCCGTITGPVPMDDALAR